MASYLSQRWLPDGGVGGATDGVLVGGGYSGRPLIVVAQRGEVAAVLDAGGALKVLTHSITIKHVTLTRCTLGEHERKGRGRFMANIKAGLFFWQRTLWLWSPTSPVHSRLSVSQPNLSKRCSCFHWPLLVSRISSTRSDAVSCRQTANDDTLTLFHCSR